MDTLLHLDIESVFNNIPLEFTDYGPIHQPVISQEIKMTEEGHIKLITTSSTSNSFSNAIEHRPGTVRINTDTVLAESLGGTKISFVGVQPIAQTRSLKVGEEGCLKETSNIDKVHGIIRESSTDDFLVEFVSNIDKKDYLFPDTFRQIKTETIDTHIGDCLPFNFKETSESTDFGRRALEVNIGDIRLFFVCNGRPDSINDATIIYEKVLDEDNRRKIRNCISFCLGKELHYHGYLTMNSRFEYVEYLFKSNYSKVKLSSYPALLPTPLGKYQHGIGSDEANELINALYKYYEDYNLGHVLWGYWHALDAPIHIAAVHFGACIESFQSAYVSHHLEDFPSKLLEKSRWKAIRPKLLESLESAELSEGELKVLINKINNLNQVPQSVNTSRFLTRLGLSLNDIESNAWKERNNAAHGNIIESDSIDSLIRNIKVLKCLLHRMLLKATGGSRFYYDYYSLGFPVRPIDTAIGHELHEEIQANK